MKPDEREWWIVVNVMTGEEANREPGPHDAYANPVDGGMSGYQGRCWDCDWQGTEFLRGDEEMGTEESRVHKRKAKREAAQHRDETAGAFQSVRVVPESRALAAERALFECAKLSGADLSDGAPTWPQLHEWAVEEVRQRRVDSDEALEAAERRAAEFEVLLVKAVEREW